MAAADEARHERAWADAREQLDFILKKDMEDLAALAEPPPLALLAVRAAVAAAGLLPGRAEDLGWDSLRPLLAEPGDLLGRLAGLTAPDKEHALATLGPLVASADFRPENLLSVSRAAAHLCSWCLALFVHSGGAPVAQAPRARPERQRLEEWKAARPPRAGKADVAAAPAGGPTATPRGDLRVLTLSGGVMTTLGGARPDWTRCEIVRALKKGTHVPDGKVCRLVCGTAPLTGATTLAELGLDPTLPEGAEITAILSDVPEEVRPVLDDARRSLDVLCKRDLSELRTFMRPPRLVELTLKAVHAALHPDVPPDQVIWKDLMQMSSEPQFLHKLRDFDIDSDPEGVQRALAPFAQDGEFVVELVGRQSRASAGLCCWCRGIYFYSAALAGV